MYVVFKANYYLKKKNIVAIGNMITDLEWSEKWSGLGFNGYIQI